MSKIVGKRPYFGRIRGEATLFGRVLRKGKLKNWRVELKESEILLIASGTQLKTRVTDAPWSADHLLLHAGENYAYAPLFGLVQLDAPAIARIRAHVGDAFVWLGQGMLASRAACRLSVAGERTAGVIAGVTASNEPLVFAVLCSRSGAKAWQHAQLVATVDDARV